MWRLTRTANPARFALLDPPAIPLLKLLSGRPCVLAPLADMSHYMPESLQHHIPAPTMPYRQSARRPVAIQARALHLQAQRQQKVMRIVGALVGLTIVVGGLFTALNAQASTSTSKTSTQTAATGAQGTVQAVRAVEVKGKGSGVGVVTGAVLGGLVGNQMGKGTGNTLMTVGGAVAGGYAGNEVEKNVKKQTLYKTTVKLDDGSVHDYTIGQQFAVGARVKVSGKKLTLAN